jgi:tetratricopeptide (TPR) repeat protein
LTNYRAALEVAIAADPSNPVPHVRLARSLLNEYWTTQDRELLEESLDIIAQGTDENDTSEALAVVQADVLQADGQLRRAIDDMDRFLVRVPGSIAIRQRLIDGHLDADDLEKAIAAARGGIAVDSADATWHERLGDLLNRASGEPVKVLPPYLEAYARNQSSRVLGKIDEVTRTSEPWPWQDVLAAIDGSGVGQPPVAGVIEAKALHGLGRQRDALQLMTATYGRYREAIENKWIASSALMDWYADLRVLFPEDPSEAEAFAHGVLAGNADARDIAGLALLWKSYGAEHVDRAVQLIDDVLPTLQQGTAEHATLLATRGAYLVEAERYQEGSDAFAELVDAYPDNPAFLNNYAYIVGVYLDQPAKALPIAQKAASLAPRFPSVLDTVATLYHRTGDDRRAADTLSFLVQIDPTNAEALARLAVLYAGSLEEADRAVPLAERARSQKPRSAEVLDALGWSYVRSGRPGKGEEFLNRSIAREPTMNAYMHLAQALSDRGKAEEAINTLRLAEDLATDSYSRNSIRRLEDDIRNAQAAVGD